MSFVAAHLDLAMAAGVVLLLLSGYPVAFALGGGALLFALVGAALEVGLFAGGDLRVLTAIFGRIYGLMDSSNEILIAVPLFVLMGVTLERSRVAADLLERMGRLFGAAPGGLGVAVLLVGALLAASTGIVGATVVAMGLISLPSMLRHGYAPPLACGVVAASGTLGQIIPPSIVLVILGDVMSNAWLEARRKAGDWAPEPVTIGDLFAGALLPGLGLVLLYLVYLLGTALLAPRQAPAIPARALGDRLDRRAILGVVAPPILLSVGVLGSILFGVATPTEAAAVGAVGAVLIAGARLGGVWAGWAATGALAAIALLLALVAGFDLRLARAGAEGGSWAALALAAAASLVLVAAVGAALVALWRARGAEGGRVLPAICLASLRMTAMVFAIYIGAQLFVLVFRALGGDHTIAALLADIPGGPWAVLWTVMAVMFVLGFFLDFLEITFVVVPLVAPVLFAFTDPSGAPLFSPVWLAVMMAVNLQTSFLTPPFGFALFYLRGVAPASVSTLEIWRGAAPFVALQLAALGLLALAPGLATWLPRALG